MNATGIHGRSYLALGKRSDGDEAIHRTGPKTPSLFSVQLRREADGKWTMGSEFSNLLKGTGHVRKV
jgi:hypothetical protein